MSALATGEEQMKKLFVLSLAAVLVLLLAPVNARAENTFIYMCQTGTNPIACTSTASGTAAATFSGAFGTYGNNAELGTNDLFQLDAASVNLQNTKASNTLWVIVSGTGFTYGAPTATFVNAFSGNSVGKVSITDSQYFDSANSVCTTTAGCGSLMNSWTVSYSGGNHTFTDMGSASETITGTYSLINIYEITLGTALGTLDSLDATIAPKVVPEPATLAVLGSGFLLVGGILRRRLLSR